MSEVNLRRIDGENEEAYLWRIGNYIDDGLLGSPCSAWAHVTPFINKYFRDPNNERWREESAYRKAYQSARRFYQNLFLTNAASEGSEKDELQRRLDELAAAKRQFYDQRREYNKLVSDSARKTHLEDELLRVARSLNDQRPLVVEDNGSFAVAGDTEALIVLADWHYGLVTENIWNTYNTQICRARVADFVQKAIQKIRLFKPCRLHIMVLGDMYHGAIHTSCRVAAEETAVEQLMHTSELLAQSIGLLAQEVPEVLVYTTYGNHGRSVPEKKDNVHSDNMERVIPWWLKERLRNCENVRIVDASIGEYLIFEICGYCVCGTHGDLDKAKDMGVMVNTILSKKFNRSVDYVFTADKHHLEQFERYDIESQLVRSLCGTDDYANEKRLYSAPGQTLCFFTPEDGKDDVCNIKVG